MVHRNVVDELNEVIRQLGKCVLCAFYCTARYCFVRYTRPRTDTNTYSHCGERVALLDETKVARRLTTTSCSTSNSHLFAQLPLLLTLHLHLRLRPCPHPDRHQHTYTPKGTCAQRHIHTIPAHNTRPLIPHFREKVSLLDEMKGVRRSIHILQWENKRMAFKVHCSAAQ
jgi:hypothetical protein